MSLSAQEEVDRLFNQKEKISSHPEDRDDDDESNSEAEQDEKDTRGGSGGGLRDRSEPHHHRNNSSSNMKTPSYHIPSTVYDANTGPKGVIADAQAYERARKRSFRKTLFSATGIDALSNYKSDEVKKPSSSRGSSAAGSDVGDDNDDEEFMRKWRESRMQELQEGKRRVSPNKKTYGRVDVVDANGYLDAVERVTADTVVVVCIYDPEVCSSSTSTAVCCTLFSYTDC